MDFKKLATQYKDELMNHILPFWLNVLKIRIWWIFYMLGSSR